MTATLNQQHRIEHTLAALPPAERLRRLSTMLRQVHMERDPVARAMMTEVWEYAMAVNRKLELQESLVRLESMALPEGPPIERSSRPEDRRWMLYLPLAVLVLFCWARFGLKMVGICFVLAVFMDRATRYHNGRERVRQSG